MPQKNEYNFEFESKGVVDVLTIETCHQYRVIEKDGIIKRKSIKYTFRPTALEQEKNSCPLFINAYEVGKGRHSFGIVGFKRSQYALNAHLECDGKTTDNLGVSLCQGKLGSIQRISFPEDTTIFTNDRCKATVKKTLSVYEIAVQKGSCVFVFKQNNLYHHLTIDGFEEALVY